MLGVSDSSIPLHRDAAAAVPDGPGRSMPVQGESAMPQNVRTRCLTVALVGLAVSLGPIGEAFSDDSGQRTYGQVSVEPAIDYSNGNGIYLLTPDKAPFPSKANPVATAPLYLPLYPLSSTVHAAD